MKRNLSSWGAFIGFLLVLGLGATRYGKTADLTLISLRLIGVLFLSTLVVRESWKYFGREHEHSTERRDTLLQRCRRWYRGEA